MFVDILNQYSEICVRENMMLWNIKLRNVAVIILFALFSIEVGDRIGLKTVIILIGAGYIGLLELSKVYQAKNLRKAKTERKRLNALDNLKFLVQDTNIINTKTNQQLKFIEASILMVAESCDQLRIDLGSDNFKCKADTKLKCNTPTMNSGRKNNFGVSNGNYKKKRSMRHREKGETGQVINREIRIYDISMLGNEQMCEFVKLCYERHCRNIMTSKYPIPGNLCKDCKPKGGKSIDFFQFLTKAEGKIQFFCGCNKCQKGVTDGCLKKYCKLCTVPKYVRE